MLWEEKEMFILSKKDKPTKVGVDEMKKKPKRKDFTGVIKLKGFAIDFIFKTGYEKGYTEAMRDVLDSRMKRDKKLHDRRTKLDCLAMIFSLFALGGCIAAGMIFYTAYIHSEKAVTVYINNHGEADIEAIVAMPLFLICASLGVVLGIYRLFSNMGEGMNLGYKTGK